jgi:DNA invertase Pin-like site-specific DNA recombinase
VPIGRQLAKLMAAPGDIVTVTKLDRLGRSTRAKQIREFRAGNTPIIRHR